jgi:hypothetical protein
MFILQNSKQTAKHASNSQQVAKQQAYKIEQGTL